MHVLILLVCRSVMIMDELFNEKPLHMLVREVFLGLCFPLLHFLSIYDCIKVELENYFGFPNLIFPINRSFRL